MLDDLGTESTTPWARQKLYQIINHHYVERIPLVVTTNVPLEQLDGRIRSRLRDRTLRLGIISIPADDERLQSSQSILQLTRREELLCFPMLQRVFGTTERGRHPPNRLYRNQLPLANNAPLVYLYCRYIRLSSGGRPMQTRVQKWGNSLALRIPKSFAADVGLDDNSVVELTVRDGMLVVVPAPRQAYTLDELLAAVTDDNLHGEIETDPPVGQEGW